ncbi:hypothetical protein ACOMHN_029252 [Nucella lapillus]
MSESESTSASTVVRQTRLEYEEMRRRLAETEKKLNRLARLEARDHAVSSQNAGGIDQPQEASNNRRRMIRRDGGDQSSVAPEVQWSVPSASTEDVRSVRSEISTVPGSYTGFASRPFPASTPSRPTLPQGKDQAGGEDVYDSDSSAGSLRQAGNSSSNNSSIKLLRQNQRLLSEVERLVCELQSARHRGGELSLELERSQGQLRELQERCDELRAEVEAEDKALRSAEQHLSESQRQTAVVQQELTSSQQHLKDLRSELEEEKKARTSVEAQRDEAVQNFLEAQTALEDFQRRNRERMKMLEETEDHLRDSLAHTNTERDELLQRVDGLQSTVTSQEAELGRLQALSAMDQETKEEMETQTLDLRRQLAKLTTRLHKAEEEGMEVSRLRQENSALLCEVEESREAMSQLEDMADHLRRQRLTTQAGLGDDSGNFSIHLGASVHSTAVSGSRMADTSCNNTATATAAATEGRGGMVGAEGNTNNNGSSIGSLLTELRGMLYEMDDEIRRLRSRLSEQEDDQRAVQDMRSELTHLMGKADQGERQMLDLEVVVGKLETDKAAQGQQLEQLQEELACRDAQLIAAEARLAHRNSQIIELQEDANRHCEEMARLEKEVWKKSAALSQLESRLEEGHDDVNVLQSQLSQAQHAASLVSEELQVARSTAKQLNRDLQRSRQAEQDGQTLMAAHCRQFEKQLDTLQLEVSAKENLSVDMQRMMQQAQMEAADKEKLIHQLETTLLEAEKKLADGTKHSEEYLGGLEAKLAHSGQQNGQLESALMLCRSEIAQHLTSMERTRQKFDSELSKREQAKFDSELSKREQAIERLEDRVRVLHGDIERHAEHSVQMERELADKQTAAQHLQSRVSHLEHSETALKENVGRLEQQLMVEKGQWMMESDQLERKLGSQSADLDTALARCSDLKTTFKELQEEFRHSESERASLERALQNEQSGNRNQNERVMRLEKELRDLRVELEQKIEMGGWIVT